MMSCLNQADTIPRLLFEASAPISTVILSILFAVAILAVIFIIHNEERSRLLPQGNDYDFNPKQQRRRDWIRNKKNSKKDEVRRDHYLLAQEKRIQERRRREGRRVKESLDEITKELKPEGGQITRTVKNYDIPIELKEKGFEYILEEEVVDIGPIPDDCPELCERFPEDDFVPQSDDMHRFGVPKFLQDAFVCEGLDDYAEEYPQIIDHYNRLDSIRSGAKDALNDCFDSLLSKFDSSEDMPVDAIAAAMVKLVGFLGPLFTCRDKSEVARVIIATTSQHVSPSCIAAVRKYLTDTKPEVPVPEGFDIDVEKVLLGFRDSAIQVRFLPMTKAILSTMMLMIVSGMRPSEAMSDGKMASIMEVWEKKIIDTLSFKNISDCVAEIFEFSVQVVRALKNGSSLKNLIMPNTLHKQYAALMPMKAVMLDNALEETYGITTEQLHATGEELLSNMEFALAKSKSPQERSIYTRYCIDIRNFNKQVADYLINHSFREEPYMISLYGGSSLGKSQLVQLMINAYRVAVDREVPDSCIAYVKGIAKYDDNVTNATEVVVADDVCNITPSETERTASVLAKLIDIGNNTPSMTNQAELSMKGVHYWRPKFLVATTNVQNLLADKISEKPWSLVRRLDHVEVTVKPEFRDPKTGAIDVKKINHTIGSHGKEMLAPYHQVQWFKFEESGHKKQLKRVDIGEPISFPQFLKELGTKIKVKQAEQKRYIANLQAMKDCEYCKECFCPRAPGWCSCETVMKPEAGEFVSYLATSGIHQSLYWIANLVHSLGIVSMFPVLESFLGLCFLSIAAFVVGRSRIDFGRAEMRALGYGCGFIAVSLAVFCGSFWISPLCWLFIWPFYVIVSCTLAFLGIARAVMRHVYVDIRQRCTPHMDVNPVLRGTAVIGAVVCVMKMVFMMKDVIFQSRPLEQGNLTPTTLEEVESRNAEGSEWDKPVFQKALAFAAGRTMTKEQVMKVVSGGVWRFEIASGTLKSRGTQFFVNTQLAIIAEHTWRKMKKEMDLDNAMIHYYKDVSQLGQNFNAYVVREDHIQIDGADSDYVMLKLSTGPTMPNLLDFFPTHRNHKCTFSMVFRDDDGKVSFPTGKYNNQVIEIPGLCGKWRGSRHQLSSPSAAGNCTSPAVSWDNPHPIVGLHSAGSTNGKVQVTYCVLRSEIEASIMRLTVADSDYGSQGNDVYPLALTSPPDVAPYGEVKALLCEEAHERSCVNWTPENGRTGITFFGEVPGSRITPSSSIRDSIMKPILAKHGVDVNYGPPQFNSNRCHSFYSNLRRTAMEPIKPALLKMAVDDYLDPILEKIDDLGYKDGGFLTLFETLNGIPGKRYIGPINEHTSSGFGLKGSKEKYLDIEYDLTDNGRKVIRPTPMVEERFNAMMQKYSSGRTCGTILRSALKDEAVKYDPETGKPAKEDRLFMSCGMNDVFIQKATMAKVMQLMQSLPLLTELAVGINSTTNEWDQIYQYVIAFNPKGVMEGDFSKYDVRISGQLIRAAGYVMLRIAERIGYTKEELKTLEAVIFECSNNYRIFGGNMIGIDGYMPSGIYSTLVKNGIANALLHRCAFYSATQGIMKSYSFPRYQKGVFGYRDKVHSIFQGDDSLSASNDRRFSMLTVKKFCDSIGMAYTAGDKKSEIVPYVKAEDAKFCKRGFYLHPKVGARVGNLDVNSLIKSLCTYTKSVTDEVTVLTETMDANLRELARHPEDVFNKYHRIFDEVATELGIRNLVKYIDRSYDEWWEILTKVYRGEKVEEVWEPTVWSLDILSDV